MKRTAGLYFSISALCIKYGSENYRKKLKKITDSTEEKKRDAITHQRGGARFLRSYLYDFTLCYKFF